MKILKIIGSALLTLLCLTVVVWSGYFLWSAIPREQAAPEVLNTDQLFLAEEEDAEADPPAKLEEAAPETVEEPVEEEPVEEAPEEIPEEPAEEEPADEALLRAQAYLETMTLEEKLWQLFLVTPEDLSSESLYATDTTKSALEAKPVGGVIYFAANLQDREQTVNLLANTQSYAKTPLFLAVDEEGGLVSRAGANDAMGVTHFDAAATYGETVDMAGVYNVGSTLASQLGELGFNLDFAPVADVVTNPNNTEIGNRAYSSDPEVAAALVKAMVQGLQQNGMASCLKHFPGHGSTEADSHEGLSVSTRTLDELRQTEWIPFQEGIDAGAAFVMVGHETNENLSQLPASLSAAVMAYLRVELGFDGLIITDSLKMGAITGYYTSAQAAVLAVEAGADMLLMPNDLQTAYDGLKAAVDQGSITEERIDESVLRILKTKYEFGIME